MVSSVVLISVDRKPDGKTQTGGVTYELLKLLNSTYETAKKENSIPEKAVGFLLTTRKIADIKNEKDD